MRKTLRTLAIAFLTGLPLLASAQTQNPPPTQQSADQFTGQRQGVFDCNPSGAYSMSIGALSATGGIYVPVADATVELNTGILVYKECILREVVDRERESATSAFMKQLVQAIQTGRDGAAQYVQNQGQEELAVTDKQRLQGLQNGLLSTLNPALQAQVTRDAARNYMQRSRNGSSLLTCAYSDLANTLNGRPRNAWMGLSALQNPSCDPMFASLYADELLSAKEARALEYQQYQWNWGRGLYSRVNPTLDPLAERIITPASVMQESFQQVLGSGFRQLENANDVGQMVGALFAGLNNQILGSSGGLSGLMESGNGQASYIDQVAAESAAGLRGAATNAALQILAGARQTETGYLSAMRSMANVLNQTAAQLRDGENKCWDLIISKVCATSLNPLDNNCTDTGGSTLRVATSTIFSQNVIDNQIAPYVEPVTSNVTTSGSALQLINQLIAGLTNTTSLNAQRLALQQLDSLVAQKRLHTPQDLQAAQKQQEDMQTQMSQLWQDTATKWGDREPDGSDPTKGWCNVNNQSVVNGWRTKWKIL